MEVIEAINEARLSCFHSKAIFVSGMGFFTDAYDLFIIGVASTLLAKQWHLSATQTGLINSMTLLGAFLGACVLGRLADLVGRKRVAVFDASVMLVFALARRWLLVSSSWSGSASSLVLGSAVTIPSRRS